MLCGRLAIGPSRRSVLPDATQLMLQLSAVGVSAIPQLIFLPVRSHIPLYRHMLLVIRVKVRRMM